MTIKKTVAKYCIGESWLEAVLWYSIHFLYPLSPIQVLEPVPAATLWVHLETPVSLTFMFLDGSTPEENPCTHWENMQTTSRDSIQRIRIDVEFLNSQLFFYLSPSRPTSSPSPPTSDASSEVPASLWTCVLSKGNRHLDMKWPQMFSLVGKTSQLYSLPVSLLVQV